MSPDACYQLGYVIKKHGLQGEVNIFLDVDFPEEYSTLESVLIELNQQLVPFFIEEIDIRGQKAMVKFEEVNSVDKAEELKSARLYLPLDTLPKLEEGQFYFHEVIDYEVIDRDAGPLGPVKNIYDLPNQDLFGVMYRKQEVLVPVNDDIIKKVDHAKKVIEVQLPDGLLDIYT